MATLDKIIDFSKLSEYDTKIKIHINEVKGDKNNVAFTHNYAGNAPGNISNRSFSFADAETGNASLSISEMNDKVRVRFENDLGKDENGNGHIDIVTRELPTIQYVDSAIDGAASFSVNTLSNPGGTEIKSTITQGDNFTELSYQKNQSNELPNYIYANVNGDSFPIPTTGYVNEKVASVAVSDISSYFDTTTKYDYQNQLEATVITDRSFDFQSLEGDTLTISEFSNGDSPDRIYVTFNMASFDSSSYPSSSLTKPILDIMLPSVELVDKKIAAASSGNVAQATDTTSGTIKLNPDAGISLNADGQLTIGGIAGAITESTGVYFPNNRDPRAVGNYSLLMTDAMGIDMEANRSLAVVSGYGLACKSAAAGTTEYRITNNYQNRIIAKVCEGGYLAKDEATSTQQRVVKVLSVKIGGADYTPDSSGNSSSDIIITTEETVNPDSAITNIRLFGKMSSYATMHLGNGVRSDAGGRSLVLGGAVTKAGSVNDNCLVGMSIYSSGNGNACFGRQHIAIKNRGFLAGTGHDTTNARSEGASAVGEYSFIDSNTMFAVGNGSSNTSRSNALEVTADGKLILKSPDGTRYYVYVLDGGTLTTSQV